MIAALTTWFRMMISMVVGMKARPGITVSFGLAVEQSGRRLFFEDLVLSPLTVYLFCTCNLTLMVLALEGVQLSKANSFVNILLYVQPFDVYRGSTDLNSGVY